MTRNLRSHLRTLWALGLGATFFLAGCATDVVDPAGEPSEQARATSLERAGEVLQAEQAMQSARTVEDLTGGFALGLADETAGVEMELGGTIDLDPPTSASIASGAVIANSAAAARKAVRELVIARPKSDAAPGDLLFSWTETNLDGSVTNISVYQDEPMAVVRVVRSTTWPNGNLLLTESRDEIVVDRGADLENEADDVWLALSSALFFNGGQQLRREIDARAMGGLQDDLRVDVVSTFLPRPNHPRLVDIVTTLTVDVHQLDLEADDRFVSVERITRFAGTAHVGGSPRVEESLAPEQPVAEGEEPCGGSLARAIYFRDRSALRSWTDSASWACEGGGSLSRRVVYADGSEDSLSLTEGSDGIVRLEAIERNGTTTNGQYDEANRSFEFTTNYPQGADPVQRAVQGSTNEAETAWQLDEQVTYADGFVERNHLEGSEDASGKSLSGSHEGRDGSLSFDLRSNLEETRLEGHIENDKEQVLDFTLEQLADGGAILDFVATEPGLRVVGHLEIDPDGCGEGSLTITEDGATATIEVSFCDGELIDEGVAAR